MTDAEYLEKLKAEYLKLDDDPDLFDELSEFEELISDD